MAIALVSAGFDCWGKNSGASRHQPYAPHKATNHSPHNAASARPCSALACVNAAAENEKTFPPAGRWEGFVDTMRNRSRRYRPSRRSRRDLLGVEIDRHFARFTGLQRNGLLANLLVAVTLDDRADRVGRPLGAGGSRVVENSRTSPVALVSWPARYNLASAGRRTISVVRDVAAVGGLHARFGGVKSRLAVWPAVS